MKYLSELVRSSDIYLDVETDSKSNLFTKLSTLLEHSTAIAAKQILAGLLEREQLCSTGIGMGVAIPHTRLKNLKNVVIMLLRLQRPLDYEAMDGEPVQVVFAIAMPQSANEQHLEILAEIADAFYTGNTYQLLLEATNVEQVCTIFQQLN